MRERESPAPNQNRYEEEAAKDMEMEIEMEMERGTENQRKMVKDFGGVSQSLPFDIFKIRDNFGPILQSPQKCFVIHMVMEFSSHIQESATRSFDRVRPSVRPSIFIFATNLANRSLLSFFRDEHESKR